MPRIDRVLHQANKLSRKLTQGQILAKEIGGHIEYYAAKAGGELATIIHYPERDCYMVNLPISADIKDHSATLIGIGKTVRAAARNFIKQIKEGVTIVTNPYSPNMREFAVRVGKHGSK